MGYIVLVPKISIDSPSVCKSLTRVRLYAIPWTAALQAPLSMEFSRQEYQSGLPFPSPDSPSGWILMDSTILPYLTDAKLDLTSEMGLNVSLVHSQHEL